MFVSATNACKNLPQMNARHTHVVENFHFIIQSTYPGVLIGGNYIGVRTIFNAWSKIWINDSIYHCFGHHSGCSLFELINLEKYNSHSLSLPGSLKSLVTADVSWQADWSFPENFLMYSGTATVFTFYHMPILR